SNAARNSAYDSTTHWPSIAVALRFACRAGSATFTTVPSMNDMLEPRMVAARIQRPCALPHDDVDLFADITPSSHGGLSRFIWLTRVIDSSDSVTFANPSIRIRLKADSP